MFPSNKILIKRILKPKLQILKMLPVSIPVLRTAKFTHTVKILKFGTPQTIAIIVLKIEKFDVTLH